jgi:hypothetical protein
MIPARLIAGGLAAALLVSATAAQAGGPVQTACAADFQRACPDVKPGPGGGQWQCIRAHLSEFSQPCQSAVADMKAKVQARHAAAAAAGGGTQAPPPS